MALNWMGPGAQRYSKQQVNRLLFDVGVFLVARMKVLAPIRTGRLRRSIVMRIDYHDSILYILIPPFYAIYVEFGTRFMRAVGFVRQALLEASDHWHFNQISIRIFPRAQKMEPLRAYTAGFHLPKKQQLTVQQRLHVARQLIPMSERYAREFKRRGIKFEVKGPVNPVP